MKLGNPILPVGPESAYDKALSARLYDLLRPLVTKVNGMASGSFAHSADNAGTAAPTTGTWAVGDFVRNSAPAEAGSASSMYVVVGWLCVTAGTPGTWVPCRFLTGG